MCGGSRGGKEEHWHSETNQPLCILPSCCCHHRCRCFIHSMMLPTCIPSCTNTPLTSSSRSSSTCPGPTMLRRTSTRLGVPTSDAPGRGRFSAGPSFFGGRGRQWWQAQRGICLEEFSRLQQTGPTAQEPRTRPSLVREVRAFPSHQFKAYSPALVPPSTSHLCFTTCRPWQLRCVDDDARAVAALLGHQRRRYALAVAPQALALAPAHLFEQLLSKPHAPGR
jgi:hypothetical protein